MSKQGLSKPRFDLKTVAAASFEWEGKWYTIRQAPAPVFDVWVRQFVEQIEDVNTEQWDIFDRWGIVKALLNEKFLVLTQDDGSSKLRGRAEETNSVPDEHPLTPATPVASRDYPDVDGEE